MEYIQFTERNSKMTGRIDTDNRISSTVIPTKRMCTLRRYSSVPCADLDHDVYKQRLPEIPPRECNVQTSHVLSTQKSSSDRVDLYSERHTNLKVIHVHDLLKIVGNSVSNVQIGFISSDLLKSSLFGITCFGSFRYLTLACTHL